MWGDLSYGCQGNSGTESASRKHTYLPQQVDYFPRSGLKVYKVACGNCFTVVATMNYPEFALASKYMKSTSNDHLSVALKKKLLRRMEFLKFKRQYISNKKFIPSATMTSKNIKSMGNVKMFQSNSTKNIRLGYLRPSSTNIPQIKPAQLDHLALKEYSKEKYEELKNNPELRGYFKEMFLNPNIHFKRIKHGAEGKKGKPKHTKVNNHTIKVSDAVCVTRHKCMEENVPEVKRARKRKDNFYIK